MRAVVSHRTKPKTTGEKERKVRSANRRPEQRGGIGVPLLKDDELDTGEELPGCAFLRWKLMLSGIDENGRLFNEVYDSSMQ